MFSFNITKITIGICFLIWNYFSCADIILDPEETFDASNITNNLGQNKPNSLKRSLSGIKPYPTPSPDNFFNVFVTMASNPGNFIVRLSIYIVFVSYRLPKLLTKENPFRFV